MKRKQKPIKCGQFTIQPQPKWRMKFAGFTVAKSVDLRRSKKGCLTLAKIMRAKAVLDRHEAACKGWQTRRMHARVFEPLPSWVKPPAGGWRTTTVKWWTLDTTGRHEHWSKTGLVLTGLKRSAVSP